MQKLLTGMLLPAAVFMASLPATALAELRCEATLSAAQQVEEVQSDAKGRFVATFDAAFTQVDIRLKVRGIEGAPGASRAHLHCARPGAYGPLAFSLFNSGPLSFDGHIARGTLLNEDAIGANCEASVDRPVNNIASLAFAMRDGLVYVTVHTPQFPGGEIRGQTLCSDGGRRRTHRRDNDSHDSD